MGWATGLFDGLTSNLIAEFVGILATVFIIDRILKHREESRWEHVRGLALFKAVAHADFVLHNALLLLSPAKDESGKTGELARVPLTGENIITFVRRQATHLIKVPNNFGENLRRDLRSLMPFVPFINSPRLVELLVALDRNLQILAYMNARLADEDSREAFGRALVTCVALASRVKAQAGTEGYSEVLTTYRLLSGPLEALIDRSPMTIGDLDRLSVPKNETFLYKDPDR